MDTQIVDDALADIALSPETHNQGSWATCLAAFIVRRAGYEVVDTGLNEAVAIKNGIREGVGYAAMALADLTMEQALTLFSDSYRDSYKELVARWSVMTERELVAA